MKKIVSFLILFVVIFALSSCNGGESGSPSGSGIPSGSASESLSESLSESVHTPKGDYMTAILGDSITDKKTYKNLITTHYTDYLYENCPFIENIQNVGYGGSCIAGLKDAPKLAPSFIERCSQIKENANLVIVFGGTNDYFGMGPSAPNPLGEYGDESPETFYGALSTLINDIEEAHPNARIIFVTPIWRSEQEVEGVPFKNKFGFTLEQYAEAITDTCEKRNLSSIDAFHELTEFNAETCNTYYVDGLHLNDAGNVVLGEYLAKKLAKLLD